MYKLIFSEDVIKIIRSFYEMNEGDDSTENLLLAIGAEMLDISEDTMYDMIKGGN